MNRDEQKRNNAPEDHSEDPRWQPEEQPEQPQPGRYGESLYDPEQIEGAANPDTEKSHWQPRETDEEEEMEPSNL